MEKYITDNGYGASKSDAQKGYSDETIKKDNSHEKWSREWDEQEQRRNIGFGRPTGEER